MVGTMIRDTLPAETDTLVRIAEGTAVFKPHELVALREVIDDYFDHNHQDGHRALTFEQAGRPIGFAYFAPTPMTDRTWHLYWIFVDKTIQAKGVGAKLLAAVEAEIAGGGGRQLVVETSSLPSYDLTRKFYLKHGYDQEATVRDFYADGDHQVIFRKHF